MTQILFRNFDLEHKTIIFNVKIFIKHIQTLIISI